MKSGRSNKRIDAPETRSGRGGAKPRKRRGRAVDRRTREARTWRAHYERFMSETKGRSDPFCRALATLLTKRETLDITAQRGEPIDPLTLCRVSGEIRRVMRVLGLVDGTALAMAALRNQRAKEDV